MARLITLSRAARLVGVKRDTLQKRIQAGELATFEGQLDLSELLRVYPQTKVEDSAMIERADRLIERALSRVVRDQDQLPDAEVLATRVAGLSHELGTANLRVRRFDILLQQVQDYLRRLATGRKPASADDIKELRAWLDDALVKARSPVDQEGDLYATEMLLRVMAAQAHLNPSGHEFFIQGNDSLLDSGLRAGLALNYGCSDGSCGHCKARLRGGMVKLIRKPKYRLSNEERSQGYTLMCCHTAVTDVLLDVAEISDPTQTRKQQLRARIGAVERVDDDIVQLSLRPIDGARLCFSAGQSVRLSIGSSSAEYPVASCPCDEHQLEFHIRMRPDDSFAHLLFEGVRFDQEVSLEGPIGDFVLDSNSYRSAIFVAWDTGFAPLKSLIENAMALDAAESLHLFWVHTGQELPYLHNRCRAWADALENFHYTHMRAKPEVYADDAQAHELQATIFAAIAEPHFDVAALDFYLAGPQTILEQSQRYLTARGVPAAQIHSLVLKV